jgi:hypothetical protein
MEARKNPARLARPTWWGLIISELIFVVEEALEGTFTARVLGQSIFTEADTLTELPAKVRDAVRCHFEEGKGPKVVPLHHVREEVIAVWAFSITHDHCLTGNLTKRPLRPAWFDDPEPDFIDIGIGRGLFSGKEAATVVPRCPAGFRRGQEEIPW